MKTRTRLFAIVAALSAIAIAQAPQAIRIVRPSDNVPVSPPADKHAGKIVVEQQFRAEAPSRVAGAMVTFQPRARTNWHSHPAGQTLVITAGSGFVQHWGGPRMPAQAGDVVWIPANTKHWHGGGETTPMSHVAVTEHLDGKTVEWMEAVTDEQYDAD